MGKFAHRQMLKALIYNDLSPTVRRRKKGLPTVRGQEKGLPTVRSVSSNFASADFRKIKTYNFQKS